MMSIAKYIADSTRCRNPARMVDEAGTVRAAVVHSSGSHLLWSPDLLLGTLILLYRNARGR